jgi:hypothetical protein
VLDGPAGEERNELANAAFVAGQRSTPVAANYEELFAVLAGKRRGECQRARCQLNGLAVSPAEESSPIRQCPYLTLRLKDEVFSVRSPFAVGITGGLLPAR